MFEPLDPVENVQPKKQETFDSASEDVGLPPSVIGLLGALYEDQTNPNIPPPTPYYGGQFFDPDSDNVILPDIQPGQQTFAGPASCFNISKRPKYWYSKAAMMEAFENPQLIRLNSGVTTIHDTDADQQIPIPEYSKDHLSDESIEKITLPPPPTDTTYDDHAEQMFERPPNQGLWSDSGQETTNFIITSQAYDAAGDNQIPRAPWNLDYEEEHEGVPFIIINTGALIGWDYEINQIPDKSWYIDIYEGTETLIPISPVIIPVAIIRKLGILPRMLLNTDIKPQMSILETLVKVRLTIKLAIDVI